MQLIEKWYNEHYKEAQSLFFDIENCDAFTHKLYEEIRALNDFETINQAINNYVVNVLAKGKEWDNLNY